ncbi:lytic transglycosylase domain-containing protein [Azospirillum ramasamyi]|uniref:Murein transglycosylase n=1 Tax=Azospirillum ramasamyi TaxID=682998 RepID=A0A2U9S2X9_9PROT|nr:lytic transglycosylase domain-containing protein [Azospirillum ramasamyi]AWU93672.1 murein transglycosylase [Azospirillum ramasamyi]
MPFRRVVMVPLMALALSGAGSASAPMAAAATANSSEKPASVAALPPPLKAKSGDCELAEQGDADAAFRLARRYLFGKGVRKDRRLGTAWLRAAASRGHPEARRLVNYVPGRMGRIRPWCRPGAGPVREVGPPPAEIVSLVNSIAPRYGVDPGLVLAVIQAESAFRTDAVSPKEAAGLMQLIPDTADRFGVGNVFDPRENITGGVKYLRWLLAYFQGDVTLALAGYNAGEGAVDRYKGVPPYEETRNYVRIIRRNYDAIRHPFDRSVATPSPALPAIRDAAVGEVEAELPRGVKSPKKG